MPPGTEDEGDSGTYAGYLPPEPGGPEPDLGPRPPLSTQAPVARHQGFAPPAEHRDYSPPPGTHPPIQQQLGWGSPPSTAGPPTPPQPWAHAPGPPAPDNGSAVAGLTLSISAGVLLLLSVGASSVVSIVCAALGIRYSSKGRARVDRGETSRHRGLAQAGFVTGIVTLGLSILATIFWILFVIVYATDEGFRQDLKDEFDDGGGGSPAGREATLHLGAVGIRMLLSLLR